MKDIIIIGGGLAGLVNGILLSRAGMSVQLFEEKKYPFHRVCGEYVSNEVIPFFEKHCLFPNELQPAKITQFHLSSVAGKSLRMPLDLGGFGIGRNVLDHWLAEVAMNEGVEIIHKRLVSCHFRKDHFDLTDKFDEQYQAKLVIGAFGKRSILDKAFGRSFMEKRHPYVGVKYHIRTAEVDEDVVELHNFPGGYCGVNKIEEDKYNLCYLTHRDNLKNSGSIPKMEQEILMKNPHLRRIMGQAEFLFEKPEVINEITFEKKEPVYDHMLMAGDSAGMITPLCGNGMAMAIQSASILSSQVERFFNQEISRPELEQQYADQWNQLFARRLWAGRKIQKVFGAPILSEWTVAIGRTFSPFSEFLMRQTHGRPFS